MAEITPLEAAKRIEEHNRIHSHKEPHAFFIRQALDIAASYLRAIAAGEYKRVVHGHIIGRGYDLHCSICGESADIGNNYCPSCGALMDGKDDSHE